MRRRRPYIAYGLIPAPIGDVDLQTQIGDNNIIISAILILVVVFPVKLRKFPPRSPPMKVSLPL